MKTADNKNTLILAALVIFTFASLGSVSYGDIQKKKEAKKLEAERKAEAETKAKQVQLSQAENVCDIDITNVGCNGYY